MRIEKGRRVMFSAQPMFTVSIESVVPEVRRAVRYACQFGFVITLAAGMLICSPSKAQQPGPTRLLNARTPLAAAGKPSAGSQAISQKTIMSSLPMAAQTQISAALGRDQQGYQSVARPGGFRLGNSRQAVSADFAKTGVDFRSGSNSWGMALQGYGYGDKIRAVATAAPHADANRIEYRRGELTEWYLNGPLGLE